MQTTAIAYRAVTANLDRSLALVAADPTNKRETAYYESKIGAVKSLDDFSADTRLFDYAMKAHGLSDMTYAKAFMRKVLSEGVDADSAFANQLADPRYKQFAQAFDFNRYGAATTSFERATSGTVAKFNRQALELDAGNDNEGVRLALYFSRQAATVENTFDLLGDSALLKVVQVTLGLPAATGALSVDKQAALIDKRLDIADLKDATKLAAFLDRFSALWDLENPQSASDSTLMLFDVGSIDSMALDSLLTLQSARVRG